MNLKYIQIKNYRSISDLKLIFDTSIKILVGKNESGKSNVLKAISLLDPNAPVSKSDIRYPLPLEGRIKESHIRFIFELTEEEILKIYNKVRSKFYGLKEEQLIVTYDGVKITLLDYCKKRNQGLYIANLILGNKVYSNWVSASLGKQLEAIYRHRLYKREAAIQANNSLTYPFIADISKHANTNDLIPVDSVELYKAVNDEIILILKNNHLKTVFWKYSDEYLLPSNIKIDAIIANPNVSIPLKNLFRLAGIENISKALDEARKGQPNDLRNLLEAIQQHATRHFREIWKEYDSVSFSLYPNGDGIDIFIKEKNAFTLDQRSDGFKRFISFLLVISTQYANGELKDSVLIIDEPDLSLHPSGVRYLRDELIKISKQNYVIVSTHSIFMIDNESLGNHLIVKKENEETVIEVPKEEHLFEEEVLYKAFGISTYELMKEQNIIFEGWRDKKLFKVANSKLPTNKKSLKEAFKNIGLCMGDGVKTIKNLTPIFELTNRKCIVLSDNDSAAKQHQKDFTNNNHYGVWKTFNDVDNNCHAITGEDFIKSTLLIKIGKSFKSEYVNLSDNLTIETSVNKLHAISTWITNSGYNNDEKKEILNKIKTKIFDEIKPSDIEPSYYDYLEKLVEELNVL